MRKEVSWISIGFHVSQLAGAKGLQSSPHSCNRNCLKLQLPDVRVACLVTRNELSSSQKAVGRTH